MKTKAKSKGKPTKRPEPPARPQQEVERWALSAYGRKREVKGKQY